MRAFKQSVQGTNFRSKFEAGIAATLHANKIQFTYETLDISYKISCVYKPDFILDNGICIETKGFFSKEDRRKHIAIKTQRPELDIRFCFQNSKAKLSRGKRSLTYADGGNTSWQQIISRGTGVNGGGAAFGFESGGGTSGGLDNRDRITSYGLRGSSGGSNGGDDRIAGYYRDTTAWMHIVLRYDTNQSSGDKVRYYVNGDGPKTRTTTNEPSGDSNRFNTNGDVHSIGAGTDGAYDLDAYLAEVIFADGQSYAPTQFGETKNGVWIPKDPSGTTFGNNGFHLKFENASDLGNDSSGNNNDFSVAAGLGTDHQVLDSPTFGS